MCLEGKLENNEYLWLSLVANILQVLNFDLNLKQTSTDELMKYLQHQDSDYLNLCIEQNKKIIQQNEEILEYLKSYKGGVKNAH